MAPQARAKKTTETVKINDKKSVKKPAKGKKDTIDEEIAVTNGKVANEVKPKQGKRIKDPKVVDSIEVVNNEKVETEKVKPVKKVRSKNEEKNVPIKSDAVVEEPLTNPKSTKIKEPAKAKQKNKKSAETATSIENNCGKQSDVATDTIEPIAETKRSKRKIVPKTTLKEQIMGFITAPKRKAVKAVKNIEKTKNANVLSPAIEQPSSPYFATNSNEEKLSSQKRKKKTAAAIVDDETAPDKPKRTKRTVATTKTTSSTTTTDAFVEAVDEPEPKSKTKSKRDAPLKKAEKVTKIDERNSTKRKMIAETHENPDENDSNDLNVNDKLVTKRKKVETKPVDIKKPKSKATKRKAEEPTPVEKEDDQFDTPKKINKKTETKQVPKTKINATDTDYSKINFDTDKEYNLKISSWNVAGLRALVTKGGLEYFTYEKPDIICLQEIKCIEAEVPEEAKIKGYHPYWFSKAGGRGGVAIYSKVMPLNVYNGLGDDEMDEEGRIITAEYEKFFLVCVYVPNAGRKLVTLPRRLRWNKLFEQYVREKDDIKPVIICGDMNVAHTEIDLANPKTNTKNAGFTIDERKGMTDLLELGFIDTFRYIYPKVTKAYSFWTYMGNARNKNVGWRLDYCITSQKLKTKIVDSFMRTEVKGSDHCPINLLLNL